MKNISYLLILFAIFFASCQEVIEIDLNEAEPVLVIEANINDDPMSPTLVQISKSIDYFNPDTPEFVTGAIVIMRDDAGNVDSLTEFFKGFYISQTMKGVPGRTYNLEVRHENKIYTASSKMASVVNIDSVWSIKPPIPPGGPNGGGADSLRLVACRFQDPAEKNYYRLIAELPSGGLNSFFSSGTYYLLDDKFRNGEETDYTFRGATFAIGDTVNVELRAIDEPIYKYFNILSSLAGFGSGTSSAPGNPDSNISGGALGYFSAYSVKKTQIIVSE